jgi:hypothetical protein
LTLPLNRGRAGGSAVDNEGGCGSGHCSGDARPLGGRTVFDNPTLLKQQAALSAEKIFGLSSLDQ